MDGPQEIGRPGAYVLSLARRAMLGAVAFAAAAAAALVGFAMLGPDRLFDGGPAGMAAAALLAAAAVGGWAARQQFDRFEKAWVGARSERRTAEALRRAPAHAVVHGAMLGAGGDADHVVVGPCLCVVETKSGAGRVRVEGGKLIAGRRQMRGDPVAQVLRQAAALRRVAGLTVESVVCVSDMTSPPFTVRGVWVCAPRDIAAVVSGLPARLGRDSALSLAAHLM